MNLRPFVIAVKQRIDTAGNGVFPDVFIRLLQQLRCLSLNVACGFKARLQLLAQVGLFGLKLLLCLILQSLVFIFLHQPVFHHWNQYRAGREHLQSKALTAGLSGQSLKYLLLFFLSLFQYVLLLFLIFIAGKSLFQITLHTLGQLINLTAECFSPALRQTYNLRTIRLFEVVKITPVLQGQCFTRGFPFMDQFFNVGLYHGCFAGSRKTGDIDIVSCIGHVQPEFHRPRCPFLPDKVTQRRKVPCAFKVEEFSVTFPAQLFYRHFIFLDLHGTLLAAI